MTNMHQLQEAANFIGRALSLEKKPKATTAIVLGSGLGPFAKNLKLASSSSSVLFCDIPHFAPSTVEGHKGEVIYAMADDTPVIVVNGRLHFYEGYDAQQVVFPIRALHLLGIKNLILTNASGAIGEGFEPGHLMALTDHINLTGTSPLIGKNLDELGPRFVDMSKSYDSELITLAKEAACKANVIMHEGVYAGLTGPCYETPAEIRVLKMMGAHAVGMSTVFETIAARHMGLRVLAIACLTNKAAGLSKTPISHDEVMENNAKVASLLGAILTEVVRKIVMASP